MEPTDKRVFAQTLVGMGEVYDRTISPAAAEIYFQDLKEYPLQAVLQAFAAHRKRPWAVLPEGGRPDRQAATG